ncbi:hypothetical protein D3C73_888760 [compost metagenome]
MLAGLETLGSVAQGFATPGQHQFLEGVVGARLIIARIQMDRPAVAAERFPGFSFAAEDPGQLLGVELRQRVLRMKDDRQAIDGNHLLGTGALQVPAGGEGQHFAVLDRAR